MSYKELGDVETVILGGIDKKTGKKNPTELEGYYLRSEPRANKFNPQKPQQYHIFQTAKGEQGLYGKAGLDTALRGAKVGAMTKVVDTGEVKDTGKGNPMKVFKAFQDTSNTIEVDNGTAEGDSGSDDTELFEEESPADEVTLTRATVPKRPAPVVNKNRAAEIQAALGARSK